MRRILLFGLSIVVLGCSRNPAPGDAAPVRPVVRLLEVSPPIGSRIERDTPIHVRAAYTLPPGDGAYHASLMFVTAGGGTVSTSTSTSRTSEPPLTGPTGTIDLTANAGDLRHELAQPLTAVVMLIGPTAQDADEDTRTISPAEVRERLRVIVPDSAADTVKVQVRSVRRSSGPVAARSRAIFYNGAGPSSALRGPSLPFEQAIEEYRTYRAEKALALATDERGRRSWGFAFGYADAASAIERALSECRTRVTQREMDAECRIYARGDSIP